MAPVVPEALIPPAPVLPVPDALAAFQMAEGFVIEAVAAEPLVFAPVALDFDPAGRWWVCEMTGFMPDLDGAGESEPQGRIVVLEDTDRDGVMDARTVFLEKLLLPRAVAVFPDGVLFTDEKELRWVGRDGLRAMGEPAVVVSGWIEAGNVEHKSNGLLRGLDNWLYNAKSGKRLRRTMDGWTVEATSFRGQWGLSRDDEGRLYHNNNSTLLFADRFAPDLLHGNPGVRIKRAEFAQVGSNRVWPVRVTPGVNRAYMAKRNGYPNDELDPVTHKLINATAACGPLVYRGSNFPPEWHGRALVCESSVNLVKAVDLDGGRHPYGQGEWLASTDERFRPVNLYNAPDGSVLVLDMYHGVIQHKTYITSYLREQYASRGLDRPASGHGRIYRVRHASGRLESPVDFTTADLAALVRALDHSNGWHRDMAQRVLVERGGPAAVPLLEEAAGCRPVTRGAVNALWTLEGLGQLSAHVVGTLLDHARQTENVSALRQALWASTRLDAAQRPALAASWLDLAPGDETTAVYLARAFGPFGTREAFLKLADLLAAYPDSVNVKAAAFSGLAGHEAAFQQEAGDRVQDAEFASWLKDKLSGRAAAAGPSLPRAHRESFQRGKALYNGEAACFGCHGLDGAGVANLGPPLDASEYVTGDPVVLAKILLHGMSGPITVAGQRYTPLTDMPGLSLNPDLTDAKLADIATYIRREWSNQASAVPADIFTKTRAATQDRAGRPYRAEDLSPAATTP